MKKVLAILASLSLGITATASVIACGYRVSEKNTPPPTDVKGDLSKIEEYKVEVGTDEAIWSEIEKHVKDVLVKTVSQTAEFETDYTIERPASIKEDGKPGILRKYLVASTPNSTKLQGEFYINVYKSFKTSGDDKNIDVPEKGEGNPGNPQEADDILKKIIEEIEKWYPDAKEGVDYEIIQNEDGSWNIRGIDGRIDIDYEYSYKKSSLFKNEETGEPISYTGNKITVKDTEDDVKSWIADWIKGNINRLATEADYTITGNTDNSDSTIVVEAKRSSRVLRDGIRIGVARNDISVLKDHAEINNINVLATPDEMIDVIHRAINDLKPNRLNIDYNKGHITLDNKGGSLTTTVKANPLNKEIIGQFEFTQKKIDISSLSGRSWPNIKIGATETEVRNQVFPVINTLLVVNGEQREKIDASTKDFLVKEEKNIWTVWATDNSNKITGKFTLTLGAFDIQNVTTVAATVGDDYQKVVEKTLEDIREKIGRSEIIEGRDYSIQDHTQGLTKNGIIEIIANESSEILSGRLEILVNKKSIKDVIVFNQIVRLEQVGKLNEKIINAINNKLFKDNANIKVTKKDYDLYDSEDKLVNWELNPTGGKFTVKTNSSSEIVDGEFTFNIGKINLSSITTNDILVGDDYNTAVNDILEQVRKLVPNLTITKDDYTVTGNANGKGTIQITASANSKILENMTRINVNARTIDGLAIQSIAIDKASIKVAHDLVRNTIQSKVFASTNITITNNDFVIEGLPTDSSKPIAGAYTVKAASTSKLIIGSTNISILEGTIDGLGEQFKDSTTREGNDAIRSKINEAISAVAKRTLTEGIDYEITATEDAKNLGLAQTVTVTSKPTGTIAGSFEFEIVKANITGIAIKEFGIIKTTQTENSVKEQIQNVLANYVSETPVYGKDYEISSVEERINTAVVKVRTLESSKLLTGEIEIEIEAFDFKSIEIDVAGVYQIGDAYQPIEKLVKEKVAEKFNGAWMKAPELHDDYEIYGYKADENNGNILTRSGKAGLYVKPHSDSPLMTGQANIEVRELYVTNNGNNFIDITETMYNLRSKSSTWGPNQSQLDGTNGNPIKADEILMSNRNFLITTRGIYYTNKLIASTAGLTSDDILSVNDNLIVTTKGSYIVSNNNAVRVVGLEALSRREFVKAIDNEMIITTKGVWLKITTGMVKSSISPTIDDNNKLLAANSKFIVTTGGIVVRRTPTDRTLTKVRELSLVAKDIIRISSSHAEIHGVGLILSNGTIVSINHNNVISKSNQSNTYLITTTQIYYNGVALAGTNKGWTEDDILAVNDSYLATTSGVFYKGTKLTPLNTPLNNLVKGDVTLITDDFIITKKGTRVRANTGVPTFEDELKKLSAADVDNGNITYSSSIISTHLGVWYINKSNYRMSRVLNENQVNDIKYFIEFNDYYLVTNFGVWFIDDGSDILQVKVPNGEKPNNTWPALAMNKDQLIMIEGKVLLTTHQGFFWGLQRYWRSDWSKFSNATNASNWVKEDIIQVRGSRIITKYWSWTKEGMFRE